MKVVVRRASQVHHVPQVGRPHMEPDARVKTVNKRPTSAQAFDQCMADSRRAQGPDTKAKQHQRCEKGREGAGYMQIDDAVDWPLVGIYWCVPEASHPADDHE